VSHADDIAALMPLCDSIHCADPAIGVYELALEVPLRLKLCRPHAVALNRALPVTVRRLL